MKEKNMTEERNSSSSEAHHMSNMVEVILWHGYVWLLMKLVFIYDVVTERIIRMDSDVYW